MTRNLFASLAILLLAACANDPSQSVPAAEIQPAAEEGAAEEAAAEEAPADEAAAEEAAAEEAPAEEAAADGARRRSCRRGGREAAADAAGAGLAITPRTRPSARGSGTAEHPGGFNDFSGTVMIDEADVTQSSLSLTIQMASLYTDDDRLTGHLLNEDFFDAENIPTATFETVSIAALEGDAGSHTITGKLNLHGVEQTISFPATVALTDTSFQANAEFSISRFDFGITYPGRPDDLIRDGVVIKLALNVPRA